MRNFSRSLSVPSQTDHQKLFTVFDFRPLKSIPETIIPHNFRTSPVSNNDIFFLQLRMRDRA